MIKKQEFLRKINEKGYLTINQFNKDLNTFREEIEKKYFEILNNNNLQKIDIENYHKIKIDDELHKKIWTRENRNFNEDLIKKSDLFKFLKSNLGELSFSRMVNNNQSDIFWRLVRPNKMDVGSIHADIWFWDINKWKIPKDKECLKIWMLLSKNIDSGLGVIEKSHLKKDWVYSNVYKDGLYKPEFDKNANNYMTSDLLTPFGSAVFFDYRLLHYGIYNTSNFSRISLEFTIYFNK